jgi:hypothetical protein
MAALSGIIGLISVTCSVETLAMDCSGGIKLTQTVLLD